MTAATAQPEAAAHLHACLVLGVGLRAQASAATLQSLWLQARALLPGPPEHFCAVAVMQGKACHPALAGFVGDSTAHHGRAPSVRAVPLEQMREQPVATRSASLQVRYGTGSVAEAAALAAAGPQAQLLVPRRVAQDGSATLAVALRRAAPLDCCIAAAGASHAAALTQGASA